MPPTSFVSLLQNHDQVGNRAFGERISQLAEPAALKAALAILLLAPSPPLLFMGEEFAAATPFLFFCDFGPDLAAKVSQGRRAEFPQFMTKGTADSAIPDPDSLDTFLRSKLDWNSVAWSHHRSWLDFYCRLLTLRQNEIIPLIPRLAVGQAQYQAVGASALAVHWPVDQDGCLHLLTNLGAVQTTTEVPAGRSLFCTHEGDTDFLSGTLPAYSATWLLT